MTPEEAGYQAYVKNWGWHPPTEEEPGYREYSRGWARGRAERCTKDHVHEEHVVTYPSGAYYHAWTSDEAASVIRWAGGGVYQRTGRTLDGDVPPTERSERSADDIHRAEGDHREFRVITPNGTRLTVWGESDARITASGGGTYEPTGRIIDPDNPERRTGEQINELERVVQEIRDSLQTIRDTYFNGRS